MAETGGYGMRKLVGRAVEQTRLKKHLSSKKSEFIALFGRRRVGKTCLVKSLFEKDFAFYATGIQGGNTAEQIENFNKEIVYFGGGDLTAAIGSSIFAK